MGVSEKLHQMDTAVESEKWVLAGIAFATPLKPIYTNQIDKTQSQQEEECLATTPTSAESRICSRLQCPPAPKKRKSAPLKCNYGVRELFNPPDLETVFRRRLA